MVQFGGDAVNDVGVFMLRMLLVGAIVFLMPPDATSQRAGGKAQAFKPGKPLAPGKPGQPIAPNQPSKPGNASCGHGGACGCAALGLPFYAYDFGVYPGWYSTYYPTKSTAVVIVNYPPQGQAGTTRVYGTGAAARSVARAEEIEAEPVDVTYNPAISRAVDRIQDRPDMAGFMTNGTDLFRQRDYLGAASAFRRAAPLDPDNGLPRFSSAHAQFALGDYEGAAFNLRRGFDLTPEWLESGNDLRSAYASAQQGGAADFQDHLAALRSHVSVQPADATARFLLGYVEFFTGALDVAERQFEACIELDPTDPLPRRFVDEIRLIRKNNQTG